MVMLSKKRQSNRKNTRKTNIENADRISFKDLQELRLELQKIFNISKSDPTSKSFTRNDINSVIRNTEYETSTGYTVPFNMVHTQYVTNENFEPSNSNDNGYGYIPHPTRNGVYKMRNQYLSSHNSGSYIGFFRQELVPGFLEHLFSKIQSPNWRVKQITQEPREDVYTVVICHATYSIPPCTLYIKHKIERPFQNTSRSHKRKRVETTDTDKYRHYFYVSACTLPLIPEKYVLIVPTGPLEKRRLQNFKFESIQYQIHYKTRIGQSNDTLRRRMHLVLNAFGLQRRRAVTYVRRIHDTFDAEENVNVTLPETRIRTNGTLMVSTGRKDSRGFNKYVSSKSAYGQAILRDAFSKGKRVPVLPRNVRRRIILDHAKITPHKFILDGHGHVLRDVFTIPQHVVLIFATLPGTYSYNTSACYTKNNLNKAITANYATEGKKMYRVIYFGGDTIQNVMYSTQDRGKQLIKGFFKDPKTIYKGMNNRKNNNITNNLGIVTLKRKVGPNGTKTKEFEAIELPISDLIKEAVKKTSPTKEKPLVIFATQCRSTSDEETFIKCYQQDVNACRRLGKEIPQKIPQDVMETISIGHHFFSNDGNKYPKNTEIVEDGKKYKIKSYTPF